MTSCVHVCCGNPHDGTAQLNALTKLLFFAPLGVEEGNVDLLDDLQDRLGFKRRAIQPMLNLVEKPGVDGLGRHKTGRMAFRWLPRRQHLVLRESLTAR